MSTDRDTTRVIQSWLHEDAHEDANRVLESVLDQIDTTPQRRPNWPARRFSLMNTAVRVAIAAAALVVVAFIGLQLFGGSNVGGPRESPSLEPTPSPSAPPPAAFPPSGALPVGRLSMTLAGVPLSIELRTAGWTSNGIFGFDKGDFRSGRSDAAAFIVWPASAADNVFADPCTETPLDPPAGRSAAELAAAVSSVPGTYLVSGPSAVTIGGHPAQHVVIRIPEDIGCAPNQFYLWYDADDPSGESGRYATALGSTIYVWIIDVDGTIVWIDGETYATSGSDAAQEVQRIVESIQFD